MENIQPPTGILERLLARTGGWYILFAALVAQVVASVTLLLGVLVELLNAEYPPEIYALLNPIQTGGLIAIIFTLNIIVLILSGSMRKQLTIWKSDPDRFTKEDNQEAWKSSHGIVWKFGISAVVCWGAFIIVPKTLLLNQSRLTSQDQVVYGIIAGVVSTLAFSPLATVIFDRLLIPVRIILLPKDFSHQLHGISNLRILYKILAVVFISLTITALLISPIGYHQTTTVLYKEIGSIDVLVDLQSQSVLVSIFAILFAASLVFLLSRSISDPLQQLLRAFQKVEGGDLSTRVPVISTDEVSRLAIYFNRMAARFQELHGAMETRVKERTSQLEALNEVGQVAASTLDPDQLLSKVTELITREFGYYYSAIFLIDPSGRWAELQEATGDAGKVLKESKHRLEINDLSMVGRTINRKQAQIALDVGEKAVRFDNPLLPYTRSEIALPLSVGDRILGALDVQSTAEAAFSEQEIETMQGMANQVAIALENARFFQEMQQSLQEMNAIQKQYLQEAWIDTNLPHGEMSYAVGDSIDGDDRELIEVPVALRNQIIGQLKLERGETLSQEEQNWIQAIATQAAFALENARLLEESQGAAMREKFVSDITNKIWASTTVESVLQTAVRELGQILDASEATIELSVEDELR